MAVSAADRNKRIATHDAARKESNDMPKIHADPEDSKYIAELDQLLNELTSEAGWLKSLIDPARSGRPSDVYEVTRLCRIVRRYGELIDARFDAWFIRAQEATALVLDPEDAKEAAP